MSNACPSPVLPEALGIAQPLVMWLLRSGVGYGEFVAALKPLFLALAEQELRANSQKVTDSALSMLSGLHRKDVRALRATASGDQQALSVQQAAWGKPSLPSQVVTRWLSQPEDFPERLPLSGTLPGALASFESLVQSISRDVHPRSVLKELLRLGIVQEADGQVQLLRQAFVPDPAQSQARSLLAGSVADHLQAGVHNLTTHGQGKFLEQSVFADGLSPESVQQLHQMANVLWSQALQQVVQAASALCDQDVDHPDPQRFRLGMFSYSAAETACSVPPAAPVAGDPPESSS